YDLADQLKNNDFIPALESFKNIESKNKDLEEFLENLIKEMEEDPYIEMSTMEEYKGIRNSIRNIKNKDLSELKSSIHDKMSESADKADSLSEKYERLAVLSEEITKNQRMSDILSSVSDSMGKAKDISDVLESDAGKKEIWKKIDKLKNLLQEMGKALSQYPQELPEEFINQEGMENIDFSKSQKNLSDLVKAIQNGDYEKSKEILDEMIKSMENIMKTMNKAAENTMGKKRNKLMSRVNEAQNKLQKIIQNQEELIKSTEDLYDYIETKKNKYQEHRMEELRELFSVLKSTTKIMLPTVQKEFNKGYLYRTPEILNQTIEKLKSEWKKNKIREFLKELEKTKHDREFLQQTQKTDIKEMASTQKGLKKELSNLIKGLNALSYHSAMIDPKMIENLNISGLFMSKSEAGLAEYSPSTSLPYQRQALSYLIQSKDMMNKFSKKLNSMPMVGTAGKKILGPGIQQPGFSGKGRTGFREGYIEIPGPGQAHGGEEFREKILKALKEKYPEKYKELIEEYFKSIGE
ncbi:MAG: DUF4175 family protein, partial [Elusimicrobiota bacterium]